MHIVVVCSEYFCIMSIFCLVMCGIIFKGVLVALVKYCNHCGDRSWFREVIRIEGDPFS